MSTGTSVSDLLGAILNAFREGQVSYCVLRNYEGYPSEVTGDLDLLTDEKHAQQSKRLLLKVAETLDWRLVRYVGRPYGFAFTFFRYEEDRQYLVVDLFIDARWYVMPYLTGADILSRVGEYRSFPIPDPIDQMLITAIHHLLWNGYVPDKYHENLVRAAQDSGVEAETRIQKAFGANLSRYALDLLRSDRAGQFAKSRWRYRFALLLRSHLRHPWHSALGWVMAVKRTAASFSTPGAVIVLVGDPSKSSYLKSLSAEILKLATKYHLFYAKIRKSQEFPVREEIPGRNPFYRFVSYTRVFKFRVQVYLVKTLGGLLVLENCDEDEMDLGNIFKGRRWLPRFQGVFILTTDDSTVQIGKHTGSNNDPFRVPNSNNVADSADYVMKNLFNIMPTAKASN